MPANDKAPPQNLQQLESVVEFCKGRLQESTARLASLRKMKAKRLTIADAKGRDVLPSRIKANEQELFDLINRLAQAQAELGLARMSPAPSVDQNSLSARMLIKPVQRKVSN